MEDYALDIIIGKGPSARSIRLKLPRFTVIGATTRLALSARRCAPALALYTGWIYYDLPAMRQIILRAAGKLNVTVDETAWKRLPAGRVVLRG